MSPRDTFISLENDVHYSVKNGCVFSEVRRSLNKCFTAVEGFHTREVQGVFLLVVLVKITGRPVIVRVRAVCVTLLKRQNEKKQMDEVRQQY